MLWVRNVFLKYGLGAKRLSEIWFGCETSFWNMVWVRNVFRNYENGGETSFLFERRGRNVFPKYELGAKRLTKKWCELTMVPTIQDAVKNIQACFMCLHWFTAFCLHYLHYIRLTSTISDTCSANAGRSFSLLFILYIILHYHIILHYIIYFTLTFIVK